MTEAPDRWGLSAVAPTPMGVPIPPELNDLPSEDWEDDPHESVTIAPPAPNFEELLHQPTPVPSLSRRSDTHFSAALDAGTRAGLSLDDLARTITNLSSGVVGAREANAQVVQELATLRAMLGSANEQQLALRHRGALLEQELALVREQAAGEQAFLIEQQDEFLAALLEDHEEAVRAASAGAEPSSLPAQLDEAQARVAKLERECAELRAEVSQLRAQLGSTRPSATPPPVTGRPPSFHPPAALRLDADELDITLRSPVSGARMPNFTPAPGRVGAGSFGPPPSGSAPPPRNLGSATVSLASLPPAGPSEKPPLKQKPAPTTRPLVSYSLAGDGVLSETLEDTRLSSKPPQKR